MFLNLNRILNVKLKCILVIEVTDPPPPGDPCQPNPCGPNMECRVVNGLAVCSCKEGYVGSGQIGCRPECVGNNDCPPSLSCIAQKCKDPCPGSCAQEATCRVVNHRPQCECPPNYVGNPFISCVPSKLKDALSYV